MDNPILNLKEAADLAHCSVRYLGELVAAGQVPHLRFAGKTLFFEASLLAWLKSQEVLPNDASESTEELKDVSAEFEMPERFKVISDCNVDAVWEKIAELREYRTQKGKKERFVSGLAENLSRELQESNFQWMNRSSYSRLSRWCHCRKQSVRNNWVQERAREISMLLFARVIERTADPSYI